ncbi:uncharacterized protein LOC119830583 [Zerene cesonia]|uniref:uncharacterized protein LOC119830583 n=1 Tax=Zerene cesonia TaxID=33412 RepID=UPI0018E56291|nr:uncharacterized protein LOC119830583 [Zerene cesonia]
MMIPKNQLIGNNIVFKFTDEVSPQVCQSTTKTKIFGEEENLTKYIMEVLEHFKTPDPVGLPGANIPDPYHVPDMKQYLTFGGSIAFKNTAVLGISKFRLSYVNVEASAMQGTAILGIDKLHAHGNYSLHTWLKTYSGNYTADVEGIKATGLATLGVETDGRVRVQNVSIDIAVKKIDVQFENSGILAFVMQGLFNSLGTFLFDTIKPYILKDAYTKIREEVNKKLEEVDVFIQFPNSISPVDMLMIHARKKIIALHKDPFIIDDYVTSVSVFNVALNGTSLIGLSSFYRIGNITFVMDNNTIIVDFDISTQEIHGSTNWHVYTLKGMVSRFGIAMFTIDYIRARIILGQPLDTRKRPQFRHLDVDLGNLQIRFDGAGTFDYVTEFAINVLPNLLRNQIMNSLEDPIRLKIQREFNEINVEDVITENLPKMYELQQKDFNPCELFFVDKNERSDEDDFFNF